MSDSSSALGPSTYIQSTNKSDENLKRYQRVANFVANLPVANLPCGEPSCIQ